MHKATYQGLKSMICKQLRKVIRKQMLDYFQRRNYQKRHTAWVYSKEVVHIKASMIRESTNLCKAGWAKFNCWQATDTLYL